ncbi:hypothetical protein G3580_12065 [Nitrogeniibacter mangrovi]|uniref:Membrane-anchored protein n=1 Tax=Nitrogeniibacter mangrovi TaxID=2016596 RepID=A0A6C1B3T3_9RHOO|nr:hypothetical protein [Nitrogeniibacter mangrovi]QID18306.1 hypothetical protein G3580_12065 [Nitrogeniibacter mangrovi]
MHTHSPDLKRTLLNKVPEVTIFFWLIKVMATTVGETAADFLSVDLHLGLTGTSWVMGVLLLAALGAQLRARQYVPWRYWITVVLVSIFGTLVTDNLVDTLGVSLEATTVAFTIALAGSFALWYASERTLSIHTIFTRRRELFYWAAILFTFALGTAAGDLLAEGLDLGYGISAATFGALILAITVAFYRFRLNGILAFWMAYVLTRPFGASCGDLLSQPTGQGGLGLGTVGTSALFLATIVGLVLWLTLSQPRPRQLA